MSKPEYRNLVDKSLVDRNVTVQTSNGIVEGRLLAYEQLKPHTHVDVIETKDGMVVVNLKHVKSMTIHDGFQIPKVTQAGLIFEGDDDEPIGFIDVEAED